MGIWDKFRERISSYAERQADKRRFLKLVDEETLPIRRQAYLEQKKKQAIEEGKRLAKKELKKEEPTREEFKLNIGGKHGK